MLLIAAALSIISVSAPRTELKPEPGVSVGAAVPVGAGGLVGVVVSVGAGVLVGVVVSVGAGVGDGDAVLVGLGVLVGVGVADGVGVGDLVGAGVADGVGVGKGVGVGATYTGSLASASSLARTLPSTLLAPLNTTLRCIDAHLDDAAAAVYSL